MLVVEQMKKRCLVCWLEKVADQATACHGVIRVLAVAGRCDHASLFRRISTRRSRHHDESLVRRDAALSAENSSPRRHVFGDGN